MSINKNQRTITDGQALVAEFNKSGLKPTEFSAQKNIPYYILQYWRNRCKVLSESKSLKEVKFSPINLLQSTPKSGSIKLTVNAKITMELPSDIDWLQFKKLLEVCVACG